MQKKNKIILSLVFLVVLVSSFCISCFADTHTPYNYVEMQPSPFLPSTVTSEVKTGTSEVFLATQTVQGSIFVEDNNEIQLFSGTTYNTVLADFGSGTYPTGYATYWYPETNYGYNTSQRISSGSTYLGSYGAFLSYYPTTFYYRDFEDSAVFRPTFSSPDIVLGDPTRLLVSAKLVCDINGETNTYSTNFYARSVGFSGANNEYCTYEFDIVYLLASMGVTFHNAPLNVHSFEISLSPECQFDDFWEPVDSRFRWLDVRFNSYPADVIPEDFNDGRVIYQQVVNTRNFSDLLDWLGDVMESVLTTELFVVGNISVTPAILLSTIVGLLLILMVLKFFAGG